MRSLLLGLARRFTSTSLKPPKVELDPTFTDAYKEAIKL